MHIPRWLIIQRDPRNAALIESAKATRRQLSNTYTLGAAILSTLVLTGASVHPALAWRNEVHFRIHYGGFAQLTGGNPHGNPPFIIIHGTAVGLDSTFGLSTASFDQTVVLTNPNRIKDGSFVFTAQDGSTLTGAYHGPASPPNANGLTAGVGTFSVTGGTGRFASAHGGGRYTVAAQLFAPGTNPAASIQTTFEGEIDP